MSDAKADLKLAENVLSEKDAQISQLISENRNLKSERSSLDDKIIGLEQTNLRLEQGNKNYIE